MPVNNGAPANTYTVVLSFLVDENGNVKEVKAVNDPGYGTAQEAVRMMQNSPKWTPAVQNGHKVTARVKQTVTFQVSEG